MKEVLLFIHELPQNILGLLVIFFTRAKKDNNFYWRTSKCGRFGVSLGSFVIFGAIHDKYILWKDVKHEMGHQKQSLYLGWLYLPVVGLPSLIGNIWDRIAHKKWGYEDRIKWYYSRFPENWADKLGGVER